VIAREALTTVLTVVLVLGLSHRHADEVSSLRARDSRSSGLEVPTESVGAATPNSSIARVRGAGADLPTEISRA
jgi:hypothetical protein